MEIRSFTQITATHLAFHGMLAATASAAITEVGRYHLDAATTPIVDSATVDGVQDITSVQGGGFSVVTAGLAAPGSTGAVQASAVPASGYFGGTAYTGFTDNFAMEVWVKPDASAGSGDHDLFCMANSGGTVKISLNGGQWCGVLNGTTFSTGPTAVLSAWTPVAIVRAGGVTTLYVNGVAQPGTSSSAPVIASPMLFFGPGGANGYRGLLDEARILTFAPGDNVVAGLSTVPAPRNLTWDADGIAGGASGGAGTWDTSSSLWDNGGTMTTWNATTPDNATFGGTAGTVTLGGDMHAGTVTFNPSGYLIDIGSDSPSWSVLAGTGGFTQTGSGVLTLSGASTATGVVTVNGGTLAMGGDTALGTTSVTLDGGTLQRNAAGATVANAISLGSSGGTVMGRTSAVDNYATLSGKLSGVGAVTLDGLLSLSNSANDFGGNLTLTASGGTYLRLAASEVIPDSAVVTMGASSHMKLNGATETIAGLAGSGEIWTDISSTALVIDGSSDNTYDGRLGTGFGGTGIALTKRGTGIQALSGDCTYSGTTTVNAGVLQVDGTLANTVITVSGTGTLTGTGTVSRAVTVNGGGLLSGTGTFNGATTIDNLGILSPGGESIGTLTVHNTLALQAGSTTTCQINKTSADPEPLTQDQVFANEITYGGTLVVVATGDPLAVGDSFRLFDSLFYGGSFATYVLPALPAGLSWEVSGLVTDGTIKVANTLNSPVINPPAGAYAGSQSLSITSNTGSTIHYTLDGSDPQTSGTRISSPSPVTGIALSAPSTTTIRAYAQMAGFANSPETNALYTILTGASWITGGDGYWSDSFNWQAGAVADGSGITVNFSTLDLSADSTVTLDGSRSIGKLVFGDTTPDSNWFLNSFGGEVLTLDAAVPTIEVVNQAATVSVVLGGTNGLTKTGAGELILGGQNTYTGGTTVAAGVLKIATTPNTLSGPLGATNYAATSVNVLSGGTLDLNGAAAGGFEGVRHGVTISGSGSAGQGALINDGVNGSPGVVSTPNIALAADATIAGTGGIYMISPAYAANSLSLNGHTLTKSGTNTFWLGTTTATAGAIVIAQGTVGQNPNAGANDLSSVAISIADSDGATLALNNRNLTIGSLSGGGSTGGGVDLGGRTLTIGSDNTSPAAFAGAITGTGSMIKTGTGALTLSGTNVYTGNTTVDTGALTLAAGGSLKFVIGATSGTNNSISGAGTVTLDGAFEIDTTLADTSDLIAGSWVLESASSLAGAYSSSFTVTGFADAGGDKWTRSVGAKLYTFDETTGTLTLTLSSSGFLGWASANGVTGGPSGDSDNDGIKNLVEYALDLNFAGSDGSPGTQSGNEVTFTKRSEAITHADVTYVIETSPDLVIWTPVVTHAPGNTDPTISYSLPPGATKLFSRLNVTIP